MAQLCKDTRGAMLVIPCVLGYTLCTIIYFSNTYTWVASSHAQNCSSQKKKHHLLKPAPIQKTTLPPPPDTPEYVLGFDPYSPEFANELMAVFSQDSLATRLNKNEKSHPKVRTLGIPKKKTLNKKATKAKEKLWIGQVLQDVSKILPFQSNLDLGSNSTSDVYVQLSAAKSWPLFANWNLDTSQTFRYGAQSKNYSETDFNFSQKSNSAELMANQLSVIKTYESQYNWNDKLFMKQKLWLDHQLTYGLYTSGTYNKDKKELEIQSWGPYLGWRLPLWRTWLYLDNDVSYYKDSTATDGYSFNVNLQLEAIF
ncbi:hypothetical protein [Acinetobacter boissieri]|uniref:Selenocysteine synthase n=1 Tax=Acinetobacter boissieri TaxID=1219383 RepID=A0A1G6I2H4_9GAMM|nr:hypothetical protein [Acinetobacter boissieri]SDC00661.1 hypothetical protein SAMN05421733_107181 [Acinetobacter boissieri]